MEKEFLEGFIKAPKDLKVRFANTLRVLSSVTHVGETHLPRLFKNEAAQYAKDMLRKAKYGKSYRIGLERRKLLKETTRLKNRMARNKNKYIPFERD